MNLLQNYWVHGEKLADLAVTGLFNLIAALAIFFSGKWLAQMLLKLLRVLMRRGRMDETLAGFLGHVLYGLALVVVVFTALAQLGVNTASAAAVLGGAALAIGLSLQAQLASFAAGVVIIIFRPFNLGDYVEIGGQRGFVEEIKIVTTQLRTLDNKLVIVPNSSITSNIITNFTARPTRRIDITVPLPHEADLMQAKQLLAEVLNGDARVLKQPAPAVSVKSISRDGVELLVSPWVHTPERGDVEATLLEAIKLKLDQARVPLAAAPARIELKSALS
ncbi:MAG TPA: mechanosensitive ion channel domain-containing protein [Nevskiaceae bacterium]|nr:mechanosensitive ion channel domain-containing protein [Nevskiaceae bacterium]